MRAVAILCFFLSGASGLIFEVIWTRMFSLVFGATTLAISTVLTAFMGGLALGSYLAGRYSDRLTDPLKAYALCEAGIGATALALPLVVGHFAALNSWLYASLSDNYALLAGARFVISASVLVVPTTLMGATLPLLSRYFIQSEVEHARVGTRVGMLYAINIFGAVAGTALGGFVLLPNLGLSLTNTLAASTNLLLAGVVIVAFMARRLLPANPPMDPEVADLLEQVSASPPVHLEVPPRARLVALVAFAVSGAVAMIYQQIWTRTLSMNIGSSVYSFTIVLVAFLIGLAGGAAIIGRLAARTRDPVGWLSVNHLAVAVLAGGSYLLADKLPFIFLFLIRGESLGADTVQFAQFLMALLVMLPATFAMGGVLPLTMRIYASSLGSVGRDVGSAYSVNTVGAIVGAFLGGFVVIPVLQLQPGTYMAVCLNAGLCAMLALAAPWRRARKLTSVVAAVAVIVAAPLLPRWNLAHLSAGLFRLSIAREVLQSGDWTDPELVYHRDGIVTSVTVERWSSRHYSMKNNGKVDASTGDDMPTQITVGLLPLFLHPGTPELKPRVALIGYASGVTAGTVLQYPVSRLDVIELEPAVLEGSVYFEHVNNKPMADPRLRLISDDGRNFLAAGTDKYDVIINEPSNPWLTGVANLFTREYFEICRRRLKQDGILATWVQMYEMSPRHIKSIYRSFVEVFPYVYAFSAEALSSDTFLIGSNRPLRPDIRRLRRVFEIPKVKKELKRAKVLAPDDFLALTLLGPGEARAFTMGAEINTDDNALIEFGAPRDLFNHKRYDYFISRVYGHSWIYGRLEPFIEGYSTPEDYAGLVHALLRLGKFREATHFFKKIKGAGEKGDLEHRVSLLMDLLSPQYVEQEEVPLSEGGADLAPIKLPNKPGTKAQVEKIIHEYNQVERLARGKAFRSALDLVEGWPEKWREEGGDDFQLFWGFLVYKCQDFHTAWKILEPLWEKKGFAKRRPALLYYLGRAYYGNADYGSSVKVLEQWIAYCKRANRPVIPRASPLLEPGKYGLQPR